MKLRYFKRSASSLLLLTVILSGSMHGIAQSLTLDQPLLADGTYSLAWSVKWQESDAQSYDDGAFGSGSSSSSINAEYTGKARVSFQNPTNSNQRQQTTTIETTNSHGSFEQVHDSTTTRLKSGGHFACDMTDIEHYSYTVLEPDKYMNIATTNPMFRLQPFKTSDGRLQMHWPITHNPDSVFDLRNSGVDPRPVNARIIYNATNPSRLCDGVPSNSDQIINTGGLNPWANVAPTTLTEDPSIPYSYVVFGDLQYSEQQHAFVYDHTFGEDTCNGACNGGRSIVVHMTLSTNNPNQAPIVSAGSDFKARSNEEVALSGSVTDDGLPNPPNYFTTTWSVDSKPDGAIVTFDDSSSPTTKATFSKPGHYVLRLTANDTEKSNFATVNVDVLDHYRVEMKAWIPKPQVVDPYAPDIPYKFPQQLVSQLKEPLKSCVGGAFGDAPKTHDSVDISSHFIGDTHADYGDFNSNASDYRMRTYVEFDFDGTRILNFTTDSGVGKTSRFVEAIGPNGISFCNQIGIADSTFYTKGQKLGDRTFSIGVSGYDPLVPRSADAWASVCSNITALYPPSITGGCDKVLDSIPVTPSIDGNAQVHIGLNGVVTMTYSTDYFPSYGLAVQKNNDVPWRHVANDASCVATEGYAGTANILTRLQSGINQNIGEMAADTSDSACVPSVSPSLQWTYEKLFRSTLGKNIQPFFLVVNSYLP